MGDRYVCLAPRVTRTAFRVARTHDSVSQNTSKDVTTFALCSCSQTNTISNTRHTTSIPPCDLSLPDTPHVYAIIGGGKWGPRLSAKSLLEAVYVDPWNHVTVVDLEVAVGVHCDQGLDEVLRCPACWMYPCLFLFTSI